VNRRDILKFMASAVAGAGIIAIGDNAVSMKSARAETPAPQDFRPSDFLLSILRLSATNPLIVRISFEPGRDTMRLAASF
jgi:hypothetical protein